MNIRWTVQSAVHCFDKYIQITYALFMLYELQTLQLFMSPLPFQCPLIV